MIVVGARLVPFLCQKPATPVLVGSAHVSVPAPSFRRKLFVAPCADGNDVVMLFNLTMLPVEFT